MSDRAKAVWAWVYHWLTVLGALVFGGASLVLQQIDTLTALDFGSILPPTTALRIVTSIAVVKWGCTLIVALHGWLTKETPA